MAESYLKACSISLTKRKMQIRTALRSHYTAVRMAKSSNKSDRSRQQGEDREQGEYSLLLVGVQISTDTTEINMLVPQKIRNQFSFETQLYNPWAYTQSRLDPTLKTFAQLCSLWLYSLFLESANNLNAPNKRTDKENVKYLHNG